MTDYKTVFQLAQDKGYKLFFDWSEALESNPDHDEVYELNPQLTIAELTLIQKWVFDTFQIYVSVFPHAKNVWLFSIDLVYVYEEDATLAILNEILEEENKHIKYIPITDILARKIPTPQQALLEGITEALKLLP